MSHNSAIFFAPFLKLKRTNQSQSSAYPFSHLSFIAVGRWVTLSV